MKHATLGVTLAAALWLVMFSPWTSPYINFWLTMSASAVILTTYALLRGGIPFEGKPVPAKALGGGLLIAVALWGVFWIGNQVSQIIFPFASTQINTIYAMKGDASPFIVALLLLFVIGPAEELFWRGYIQKTFSLKYGRWGGFLAAWGCYTLIHVWSGNIMLLLAAATCGFFWGMLYLFFPKRLDAILVSHALWDAAAFVIFPF